MKKRIRDKVEFTLRIVCIVSSILFVAGIVIDCVLGNNENYKQYSSITQNITGLAANLAVSYLFFIIAFLPENRKKRSVDKVIAYYFDKLFSEYQDICSVCNKLIETTGAKLSDSPNIRSVVNANNVREFMTYLQHFTSFYYKSLELRGEVLPFSNYLDDEVRNNLYDYINTSLFQYIKSKLIDSMGSISESWFVDNLQTIFEKFKITGDMLFARRS